MPLLLYLISFTHDLQFKYFFLRLSEVEFLIPLNLLLIPAGLPPLLLGFFDPLLLELFNFGAARERVLADFLDDVPRAVQGKGTLLRPIFGYLLVLELEFEHLEGLCPGILYPLHCLLFLCLHDRNALAELAGLELLLILELPDPSNRTDSLNSKRISRRYRPILRGRSNQAWMLDPAHTLLNLILQRQVRHRSRFTWQLHERGAFQIVESSPFIFLRISVEKVVLGCWLN